MRGNGLTAAAYTAVSAVDRMHAGDALLVLREIGVAAYVVLDENGTAQVYADSDAVPQAESALLDLAKETAESDTAWDRIVAGYDASVPEPTTIRTEEPPKRPRHGMHLRPRIPLEPGKEKPPPPPRERPEPTDHDLNTTPTSWDDEGHFVPPPAPPVPRGDLLTRIAWGGLVGGPLLLLVAVVFGLGLPTEVTMVCVLAFVGGLVTLLVRMKDTRDNGPDDGAVL